MHAASSIARIQNQAACKHKTGKMQQKKEEDHGELVQATTYASTHMHHTKLIRHEFLRNRIKYG